MIDKTLVLCYTSLFIDDCRTLKYDPQMVGRPFLNHTIISLVSDLMVNCELRCYLEYNYMSINFGPEDDGENRCVLSDSDHIVHPGDLENRAGFIYRSAEVPLYLHSLFCVIFLFLSRTPLMKLTRSLWVRYGSWRSLPFEACFAIRVIPGIRRSNWNNSNGKASPKQHRTPESTTDTQRVRILNGPSLNIYRITQRVTLSWINHFLFPDWDMLTWALDACGFKTNLKS